MVTLTISQRKYIRDSVASQPVAPAPHSRSLGNFVVVRDLYLYSIYFYCMNVLPACSLSATCMPGLCGGQERAADLLEGGGQSVTVWILGIEPCRSAERPVLSH